MKLHELKPAEGSKHALKRKGRGPGSGLGKTAGGKGPGFEGGQTPIQRRLPKRGFTNHHFRTLYSVVSLDTLERFDAGTVVTPELLVESGYVKQMKNGGVKVLNNGTLTKALTVKVNACSQGAREKIEAAGGSIEVI